MVEGRGKEKCEGVVSTFSLGEPLELGLLVPPLRWDQRDVRLIYKKEENCSYLGNGNPLQYSCLENSMDGGAW